MTYRVELTARAVGISGLYNLRAIYRRIHADSSQQARDWFNRLEHAITTLDESPLRCPAAPDDPRFRHLLYGSGRDVYRVIFVVDEVRSIVTVVHVRHGAREPLKREDVIRQA
jgi:toxin ParE1/3/4